MRVYFLRWIQNHCGNILHSSQIVHQTLREPSMKLFAIGTLIKTNVLPFARSIPNDLNVSTVSKNQLISTHLFRYGEYLGRIDTLNIEICTICIALLWVFNKTTDVNQVDNQSSELYVPNIFIEINQLAIFFYNTN